MGSIITKEKKIKNLEAQIKKHSSSEKIVSNLKGKIASVKGKKK